jgi:hypothetical protein
MKWAVPILATVFTGCSSPVSDDAKSTAGADPADVQQRIRDVLARLDDVPNPDHADYTPAVDELIDIGEQAVEPTLPYLLADSEVSRTHAARAIKGAMKRMHGFVPGHGWRNPDAERAWEQLWSTLWDHEKAGGKQMEGAPHEVRVAFIERVKRWLNSRRT